MPIPYAARARPHLPPTPNFASRLVVAPPRVSLLYRMPGMERDSHDADHRPATSVSPTVQATEPTQITQSTSTLAAVFYVTTVSEPPRSSRRILLQINRSVRPHYTAHRHPSQSSCPVRAPKVKSIPAASRKDPDHRRQYLRSINPHLHTHGNLSSCH